MAKKKRNLGRPPGTGNKSAIDAQREQPVDIAFKLEHSFREWITLLNAALRKYETNFGSLPDKFLSEIKPDDYMEKAGTPVFDTEQHQLLGHIEYLWSRHRAAHEQAALRGDIEWFKRQADALKPKDSATYAPPNLGRFDKAVFDALFIRAHSYDSPEDYIWWARPRFMKKGCTAADILDDNLRWGKEGNYLIVKGRRFKDRKSALGAIRKIAEDFRFGLRSGQGKHPT